MTEDSALSDMCMFDLNALAIAINQHFAKRPTQPKWIKEPTDANLKTAGRYDPNIGQGIASEPDSGNKAGSILLLALLEPDSDSRTRLDIFGSPTPWSLLVISTTLKPRSGYGADNRRCNVIEAMLNLWQDEPQAQAVRAMLLSAWRRVRIALILTVYWHGPQVACVDHDLVKKVINVPTKHLPIFMPSEASIIDFETVVNNVSYEDAWRLSSLSHAAPRRAIGQCLKLNYWKKTVKIVQKAMQRAGHSGMRRFHNDLQWLTLDPEEARGRIGGDRWRGGRYIRFDR